MTFSLPTTLDPFSGRMPHGEVLLRTLRLALSLCLFVIPAYGIVNRLWKPVVVDPLWIRTGAWAITVGLLGASYRVRWVGRNASALLSAFFGLIIVWKSSLLYLNDLSPEVAVGFIFTVQAVGTLLGLATIRLLPLAMLLGTSSFLAVVTALSLPEPRMSVPVFVLSVVSASFVLMIAIHARIREREERMEREGTLEEAEHLAAIGSWSHDLRTSRREWSDGMYRLIGIPSSAGEPPRVFDFVEPEDRSLLEVAERELMSGEKRMIDHRYTIRRTDGAERCIHSIVRLVTSAEGRPMRLVGVMLDITKQAEYERELEGARAAAEDAASLQTSILANMSHEIRTPLTAVIGYAQLLEEEVGEEYQDLVVPILSGGERLLDTLNSVLDLARMEAGHLDIETAPLNATQEVKKVADLLVHQAASRGLTLHLEAPEAPIYALADAHALGRSVTNLISNAIKFTDSGSVTVRIFEQGPHVRLDVVDTGRGMSAGFQTRLFEPFRQESTGSDRSHEGTGLGLTITHRLVTAMGGEVSVESLEDVGTTFTLLLPAVPAPEPAAWIALPSHMRASGVQPQEAPPSTGAASPKNGASAEAPPSISEAARRDG